MASSPKRPAPEEACTPAAAAEELARYNFSDIEDYEMLGELGEGAFGVVAKARHRLTGETVAVKWIRGDSNGASDVDAVVREGDCLSKCLGHPSIVQVKDAATDKASGDLFLIMEFVGPSLRNWLTSRPVSEYVAREFMGQLLSAAVTMHAAPMIHRDIKPENILVGAGGELKICDFGVATPAKPLGKPYPEQCVGTLQYRSPEQVMGIRFYGTAVDMWALGCVMAELLIGVPLFTATTEEELLEQMMDLQDGIASIGLNVFDDFVELSPAGRELLAGLLSVNPCERLTATEALQHRWFTEETEAPALAIAEFPGFVPMFAEA